MAWLEVPLTNDISRRILHIDMDAFYASIEQRDEPSLRQKALVIAHDPRQTGGKGVVTTANYVARQYGVHSAMPANEALKLVPRRLLVFKAPDFTKYRAVSQQIHALFHQVTDLIEPVALDEAYLDVSANHDFATKIDLALWLQAQIQATCQLTCSFGLSYNKFLAKEASEYNKPNGRTVILPEQAEAFLDRLPIAAFRGVGKKTLPRLEALGITDGASLKQHSQDELIQLFGKMGLGLYQHARGVDNRPVHVADAKSIGKERTYRAIKTTDAQVEKELQKLAALVQDALSRKQKHGKTVVLKVRDADFNTITRRVTAANYIEGETAIFQAAWQLWQQSHPAELAIRLLGITVTGLDPQQFENIDLPL
ncbi:DNA polymerase IV [Lacticaseibacillus baoqingensis]|uniref:DNA polymerase IV n=1 Tax=Lacticaseibacillus baoqingensis TaxID=2486013 RepID=A0ABW4EBH4_9LACO|nr:DNA polymerase IV [Lacticaseibacillus baoqingensis]